MKYKKVILFLTTSLIALSGCKNSEPIEQPVTTETVETIEEEISMTEITETTSEITTEAATVPETTAESTTANLSQLSLTSNVTITSWGTNKFTGNKQALECSYSDEWAEAVIDVINTLQNGYGGEQQSQSDVQQNNPPANDQKGEFNVVPGLNIQ